MAKIKVKVNDKMAAYGGTLVDLENRDEKGNAPVIGSEPTVVDGTVFVMTRLRAGDLVMVMDSEGEPITTPATPERVAKTAKK